MLPIWDKQTLLTAQTRDLHLSGNKAKYRDYLDKWVDLQTRKLRALVFKIEALERNEDIRLYQNMINLLDDQITQLNTEN